MIRKLLATDIIFLLILLPITGFWPIVDKFFSANNSPSITEISVKQVKINEYLIIYGDNFGQSSRLCEVYFLKSDNGTEAKITVPITSWDKNQVKVRVPALTAGSYDLCLKTPAGISNKKTISVVSAPLVCELEGQHLSPVFKRAYGLGGENFIIKGSGFTGTSRVNFSSGGTNYELEYTVINDNKIEAAIPLKAIPGSYNTIVTTSNGNTNAVNFTVGAAPKINQLGPKNGTPGQIITIWGYNLNLGRKPTVEFSGKASEITYYTCTKLNVKVPVIGSGETDVVVNNGVCNSNAVKFTVKERE